MGSAVREYRRGSKVTETQIKRRRNFEIVQSRIRGKDVAPAAVETAIVLSTRVEKVDLQNAGDFLG